MTTPYRNHRLAGTLALTLIGVLCVTWAAPAAGQGADGKGSLARVDAGRGAPLAFLRMPTDALGIALGSGAVALAEGPSAMYWNLGGMSLNDDGISASQADQAEATRSVGATFTGVGWLGSGLSVNESFASQEPVSPGLNQNYIAAVLPGTVDFGLAVAVVKAGDIIGTDQIGRFTGINKPYTAWSALVAASHDLRVGAGGQPTYDRFSFGAGIRLARSTYAPSRVGAEFGLQWRIAKLPVPGLGEALGPFRIGYQFGLMLGSEEEPRMLRWRWGLNKDYQLGSVRVRPVIGLDHLVVSAHDSTSPLYASVGVEISPIPQAKLRASYNDIRLSSGGTNEAVQKAEAGFITVGAGWQASPSLSLDYALYVSSADAQNVLTNHVFSVTRPL